MPLPKGEYDADVKIVCSDSGCQVVAEVAYGRHRGTQVVVQELRRGDNSEAEVYRSECTRMLRVKYGNVEAVTNFIQKIDAERAWARYFDDEGSLLRVSLVDDFESYEGGA